VRWSLVVAILVAGCRGGNQPPRSEAPARQTEAPPAAWLDATQRRADFEAMWSFVDATYPFFDEKVTDWAKVRVELRPLVDDAETDEAFLHGLETSLDQLYDPHCMLGTNAASSWRPVPGEVWLEPDGDAAVVTAVFAGSNAEVAGVRVGMRVVAIQGRSIEEAIAIRYPSTLPPGDPDVRAWALLSAVAGTHEQTHTITVAPSRQLSWKSGGTARPVVAHRELEPGIGYVAVSTFADAAVMAAFDDALEALRNTKALLIDVRSNRGGDTMYAVPMMGRFVTSERPYAKMTRRGGHTWEETVIPAGPWAYPGLVFVLVDRTSISMAEGFAMGMQGLGRAQIVGTKMAGLGAAIARVELPSSRIPVQISAEPIFHVDGTPRWRIEPDLPVDVVAETRDGVDDPILEAGLVAAREALVCHECRRGDCAGGCCRKSGWYSCRVKGRNKRCIRLAPCDARCCADAPR
jgi:carboxyl-terminal processing protease